VILLGNVIDGGTVGFAAVGGGLLNVTQASAVAFDVCDEHPHRLMLKTSTYHRYPLDKVSNSGTQQVDLSEKGSRDGQQDSMPQQRTL
jgi:hypothetical protein